MRRQMLCRALRNWEGLWGEKNDETNNKNHRMKRRTASSAPEVNHPPMMHRGRESLPAEPRRQGGALPHLRRPFVPSPSPVEEERSVHINPSSASPDPRQRAEGRTGCTVLQHEGAFLLVFLPGFWRKDQKKKEKKKRENRNNHPHELLMRSTETWISVIKSLSCLFCFAADLQAKQL